MSRRQTISLGMAGLLVFATGIALTWADRQPAANNRSSGAPGWEIQQRIDLDREIAARHLWIADESLYIAEDWPALTISRWTSDGDYRGPVFEKGRGPRRMLEAASDLLPGPDGSLGVIDMRSYRLIFFDPASADYERSFLVSGYEFMPLGGAGDPENDRIYLFTNNVPEVRVLDYAGKPITEFDHYEDELTRPYLAFRGTVDSGGNLLYCPQATYDITRVAPDGTATRFARATNPEYRFAAPVPDSIEADLQDNETRWAWEKTVSWVDRLAATRNLIVVSYSVPPGMDDFRADVYSEDGSMLVGALSTPGRLLGCDSKAICWFTDGSEDTIVSMRIEP